ncbi:hypothetical protein RM555_06410 [Micromonospora sp. DSM 115977]|uniref:Secreted protein n=1 Tax=Micromonospora reichwaldensis TaxID=3075516 RepID=A0ABU2WSS3_9ACTN|nr:hypothetical protein [Micromonospora sp. DSM 115977]MDT0528623.1 hypothetical protein [Micromonospora sp. DSM 115977]
MRVRRFFTAVAVGVATMLGAVAVAPAPAQAATSWSLSNSRGDVVGAWVHGDWWWGSDGRLYLTVHVKDTAANGVNAGAYLGANYSDAGVRFEWVDNSAGADSTITKTFSFASNVTSIYGYECAGSSCGDWVRIF